MTKRIWGAAGREEGEQGATVAGAGDVGAGAERQGDVGQVEAVPEVGLGGEAHHQGRPTGSPPGGAAKNKNRTWKKKIEKVVKSIFYRFCNNI